MVVGTQSSSRYDAVNMGMVQQLLIPGVQHAEESDLRAEVFRIASDLQKRLRHSPEQEVVEFGLVLEYECL